MLYLIDPFAIVAGGAPRDWWFDNKATDIDAFFNPKHVQGHILETMLKIAGFEIVSSVESESLPEWYNKNPNVTAIYNTVVNGEVSN